MLPAGQHPSVRNAQRRTSFGFPAAHPMSAPEAARISRTINAQFDSGTCCPTVRDEPAGAVFVDASSALFGAMVAATSAAMVSSKVTSLVFQGAGFGVENA